MGNDPFLVKASSSSSGELASTSRLKVTALPPPRREPRTYMYIIYIRVLTFRVHLHSAGAHKEVSPRRGI